MELKLKEKFLLLSLDDDKGGAEKGMYHFGLGLSACILLEIVLEGSLELRGDRIVAKPSTFPSDRIHYDVIKRIRKVKKDKPLRYWISVLNAQSNNYRKGIIKNLVNLRILKKIEKKFLGIRYYRYPTLNPKPEKQFRDELLNAMSNLKDLKPDDIALLTILEASHSLPVIIKDKDKRKRITKELKEMKKSNAFGKATQDAIDQINAVIAATVVATSVATTAAIS